MAITLTPVTSGYNLSVISANFAALQQALNQELLWRKPGLTGETLMQRDIDMDGHTLLNLGTNPDEPRSLLTVEDADARYYNITGDVLEGTLDAGGNRIRNLPVSSSPDEAVRQSELSEERDLRQSADQQLQDQILGNTAPLASPFSVISWHDQVLTGNLTIPANKNAWSFGPSISMAPGSTLTIGPGSFWTIANGAVV